MPGIAANRFRDSGKPLHHARNGLKSPAGPTAPVPIAVGDRVRWNGQYQGLVKTVHGETAVVVEPYSRLFGRTIVWRLRVDALVRC
jgi:hypothetical protein